MAIRVLHAGAVVVIRRASRRMVAVPGTRDNSDSGRQRNNPERAHEDDGAAKCRHRSPCRPRYHTHPAAITTYTWRSSAQRSAACTTSGTPAWGPNGEPAVLDTAQRAMAPRLSTMPIASTGVVVRVRMSRAHSSWKIAIDAKNKPAGVHLPTERARRQSG